MRCVHNARSQTGSWRQAAGDSQRPPAVEVSLPARGSGVTSPVGGRAARCGLKRGAKGGERPITAAMFLLCSSSLARRTSHVLRFQQSPLSLLLRPSRTRGSHRRASPHRPLFYCQPTILTCARNVRWMEHKFLWKFHSEYSSPASLLGNVNIKAR